MQIASLCLKSGNAVLLKGGSEADGTNRALFAAIQEAAVRCGVPAGAMGLLHTREDVGALLALDEYVDLIIPRGSNAFVRSIMGPLAHPGHGPRRGRVPRVRGRGGRPGHGRLDRGRLQGAERGRVQRLRDAAGARGHCDAFLPRVAPAMAQAGVRLRGCERTRARIDCEPACEDDWRAEYLDYVLAVRVVDSLDAAIAHINRYGSGHTDCIVTGDAQAARRSWPRSTPPTCSTTAPRALPTATALAWARRWASPRASCTRAAPVGLDGLCTYKYKLLGSGQTVAPFVRGEAAFTHRPLHGPCPMERR